MHKGRLLALVFAVIVIVAIFFLINSKFKEISSNQPEPSAPPQPLAFFLNISESRTEEYWGHSISVNYSSSSPIQRISVIIDGKEYLIEKEPVACTTSCGYYQSLDDISFKVEPVTWVENPEGQLVWSFESWNTTQIYFEANAKAPASAGGKFL